jgi:pimeloyl-ACP methyl ester carboxylesterase
MILIQGVDSSSSCSDDPANPNSFAARRASVLNALAGTGLGWDDVYGFSYGDAYADCMYGPVTVSPDGTVRSLTWPAAGLTSSMVTPIYIPRDTCSGVRDASVKLDALVDRLIELYPGARFDLIAHSMGGLVASYYVATQDPSFIAQRIHSVILLDSPVNPGLSVSNPSTVCAPGNQSWPDMSQGSSVIATINDPASTTLRTRFICVLATGLIGQVLPGCRVVYAQNYTSGTGGAVGGTIGGVLGCLIFQPLCVFLPFAPIVGDYALDTAPVHSAVWHDPVALKAIADAVLAP